METSYNAGMAYYDQHCAAGEILPDGTLVRLEGEPPIAQAGSWYKPYGSDEDK